MGFLGLIHGKGHEWKSDYLGGKLDVELGDPDAGCIDLFEKLAACLVEQMVEDRARDPFLLLVFLLGLVLLWIEYFYMREVGVLILVRLKYGLYFVKNRWILYFLAF